MVSFRSIAPQLDMALMTSLPSPPRPLLDRAGLSGYLATLYIVPSFSACYWGYCHFDIEKSHAQVPHVSMTEQPASPFPSQRRAHAEFPPMPH